MNSDDGKANNGEPLSCPRVLVTGAGGFVGQTLVRHLLDSGRQVVALARRAQPPAGEGIQVVQGDMLNAESLRTATQGVDAVIHLAAAKNDERFSEAVNVAGTQALTEACAANGVHRFIYISTQADPRGTYGRTKYQGEDRTRASGLEWTIVRPNLIYGADENGAFAKVATMVQKLPIVPITGPCRAPFWPVHVDDVCQAILACLNNTATIGQTYVIAGSEGVSLTDLVRAVAAELNRPARMIHMPLWFSLLAARLCCLLFPDSPPVSVSNVLGCNQEGVDHDIAAMRETLGVTPRPFAEGLREAMVALKKKGSADGRQ